MIQSVSGRKKYRVSPTNPCQVQIQTQHGARWVDYRRTNSWTESSKLVLKLGMSMDDTQELPPVEPTASE